MIYKISYVFIVLIYPVLIKAQQAVGLIRPISFSVKTQLIAHDKPVHDIAFSRIFNGKDNFATVGTFTVNLHFSWGFPCPDSDQIEVACYINLYFKFHFALYLFNGSAARA